MKSKLIIFIVLVLMSAPVFASPSVSGCTQEADDGISDSTDIKAVLWNINDDYENYESDVEWASGVNLPSSFQNHFSNGDYECQYNPGLFDACYSGDLGEFAWGEVILCDAFLNNIHNESRKDRRTCYAALISGYRALSYLRINANEALDVAEAAFDYWQDRFGSTIDFDDCGSASDY